MTLKSKEELSKIEAKVVNREDHLHLDQPSQNESLGASPESRLMTSKKSEYVK